MANSSLTDSQILAQVPGARERGRKLRAIEPRALAARYDRPARALAVELTNGSSFRLPIKLIPALRSASASEIATVEVSPSGEGLHWESLDLDLSVPGLLQHMSGAANWMRQLASHGGKSRSPAKVRAARSNGAKGGRPKKPGRRNRVAA